MMLIILFLILYGNKTMSRVADILIDITEKILERLNLKDVESDTWNNIQDWIMEFAETQDKIKTFDINFLADKFIETNVCKHCQKSFLITIVLAKENNMQYKLKDIDRKIEWLSGRPDRNNIIDKDDIINLHIALETPAPKNVDPLVWFLLQV